MPKLDLKVESLLLHLKHLMKSDRHSLGMSSIPPIEILYFLLREHTKPSEFQLHLQFMLLSSIYLSLLTIRLKSMTLLSEKFLRHRKKVSTGLWFWRASIRISSCIFHQAMRNRRFYKI